MALGHVFVLDEIYKRFHGNTYTSAQIIIYPCIYVIPWLFTLYTGEKELVLRFVLKEYFAVFLIQKKVTKKRIADENYSTDYHHYVTRSFVVELILGLTRMTIMRFPTAISRFKVSSFVFGKFKRLQVKRALRLFTSLCSLRNKGTAITLRYPYKKSTIIRIHGYRVQR